MHPPTAEVMRLQLPTDEMILRELHDGRNLGANIAEEIDRHKKTVTKRLNQLEDYDLVRNIGRGVYEITERGRVAYDNIDSYDDVEDFDEFLDRKHAEQPDE